MFFAKVNKDSGVFLNRLTTECWLWTGSKYANGYGQLDIRAWGEHYAHRWACKRWNGDGTGFVLHKCDNRNCVRPDHLDFGTQQKNNEECRERNPKANGRKLQSADLPIIVERMKTELLKDIAVDYGMNWKSISRALDKAGLRPEYKQKKLTPEQVLAIKDDPRTYAVLSEEYNVSPSVISKIKNGAY
jgi:hypothetical protein